MNQFKIGNVKITRIVESETPWAGTFIMPDATPENVLNRNFLGWSIPRDKDSVADAAV